MQKGILCFPHKQETRKEGRKEIAAWKKEPPQPKTKLLQEPFPQKDTSQFLTGWGFMEGEPRAAAKLGRKENPPSSPELFGASILCAASEKQTPGKKQVGKKTKGIMDDFLM